MVEIYVLFDLLKANNVNKEKIKTRSIKFVKNENVLPLYHVNILSKSCVSYFNYCNKLRLKY
jgi:hypothetical protein